MRRLTYHQTVIATAATLALMTPSLAALAAERQQRQASADTIPAATSANPVLLYGGKPLPVSSPTLAPFRDSSDGGDVCAAPEMLAILGITYLVDDQTGQVTLAGPEGAKTVTVPPRRIAGKPGVFIPVIAVVEGLGGKCEWDSTGTILFASRGSDFGRDDRRSAAPSCNLPHSAHCSKRQRRKIGHHRCAGGRNRGA